MPRVGAAIEGEPTVLVYNGRFVQKSLALERVSPDEIYSEMRKSGLERVEQLKWALLEADGKISVIPLAPEQKQIKPREDTVG
jgi:uncharacterized membrane protein YcaP (DUF421 family)